MTKAVVEKKHTAKSLVEASLDIGRVLADRDGVVFRADGTCMYPTIRPGDVLRIQSRAVADVSLGDIAVCRRPTHLFSHRVVAKGLDDGRAYIVTRQDRTLERSDGPTFDENLLGIVVTIERGGKPVPLQPALHSWPLSVYFALRLALINLRLRTIFGWSKILAKVQDCALYRRIVRMWLYLKRPLISYNVRLPMPTLGDAVYRQLSTETFSVQKDWRGRPVERWTLLMHLNGACQPAAWIKLEREAFGHWFVDESYVCVRYRGAGFDAMLQSEADAIIQRDHHTKEVCAGRKETVNLLQNSMVY